MVPEIDRLEKLMNIELKNCDGVMFVLNNLS